MDPQIPPITPPKPFPFLLILLSVIVVLLLSSTAYLAYQNMQLTRQLIQLQNAPTSLIAPAPDPIKNWKTVDMMGCGTKNNTITYSIKTPDDWAATQAKTDTTKTVFNLSPALPVHLELRCDTAGIGSVICVNGGTVDRPFGPSATQDGCYWTSDPTTKGFGGQYTLKNSIGSFVFTAYGVEKTLLDQILSTFKFLDQPKNTYVCPANGWVDCMPGPAIKPECSAAAMSWYTTNCPNFKGGAL